MQLYNLKTGMQAIFPHGLHGPQKADQNPKSATHPDIKIMENDLILSTGRLFHLTASSRHLSARQWTSSTSPSSRPVTTSCSAAQRQAGSSAWHTANCSAPGFGRRAGLVTVWHTQQVAPPLSSTKQASLTDIIAAIFVQRPPSHAVR